MNFLSTKDLLDFCEGKTSPIKSMEIEAYIQKYPYYQDIIEGLQMLSEDLPEGESLEENLSQSKAATWNKMFAVSNQ